MVKIAATFLLATAVTAINVAESAKRQPQERQLLHPFPEHLPGAFTGGFGEETCRSCHFDYPLNYKEGTLRVEGIPESYRFGKSYQFAIHLTRPALLRAGVQLSARFEDGSQAGEFLLTDDRLQFTDATPDSLQYVQHSLTGTNVTKEGTATWTVTWHAPNDDRTVVIHLAANASNGDASEFGDFILQEEIHLSPTP